MHGLSQQHAVSHKLQHSTSRSHVLEANEITHLQKRTKTCITRNEYLQNRQQTAAMTGRDGINTPKCMHSNPFFEVRVPSQCLWHIYRTSQYGFSPHPIVTQNAESKVECKFVVLCNGSRKSLDAASVVNSAMKRITTQIRLLIIINWLKERQRSLCSTGHMCAIQWRLIRRDTKILKYFLIRRCRTRDKRIHLFKSDAIIPPPDPSQRPFHR